MRPCAGAEAQVAAIADDIAYNTHDIDDGLRAGLFQLDDLAEVPLAGAVLAAVRTRYPGLEDARLLYEIDRRMITAMIEDVVAETRARLACAAPADARRRAGAPAAAIALLAETHDQGARRLKAFLFAQDLSARARHAA